MKILALLLSLCAFAATAAEKRTCLYQDGRTYWMRERYFGIDAQRDAGGERQWTPKMPNAGCFRTSLADIHNPLSRDWGYRLAGEAWLESLPTRADQWNSEPAKAVRAKLAALIGRDFESLAAASAWWIENADYLTWSEGAQMFVLDENARRHGEPVTTRNAPKTIAAADYWRYEAKGHLRDVVDDGVSIRGIAWTLDLNEPEVRFRIARSELLDRRTKEQAYRRAVDEMIELVTENIGARELSLLRHSLTRVTGRSFAAGRAWANWWAANRNNARLDAQGLRLTTE